MEDVILSKECSQCEVNFNVMEEDLLPIEGFTDMGHDEKNLEFICKCPYCGNINELSSNEKNLVSLEIMKRQMMKYACCSEYVKQLWQVEKDKKEVINRLSSLNERETSLRNNINFAMHNVSKECLYNHWPLTDEIINNEAQKRKSLNKK